MNMGVWRNKTSFGLSRTRQEEEIKHENIIDSSKKEEKHKDLNLRLAIFLSVFNLQFIKKLLNS
jgi:hypothetical protein